MIVPAAKYVQGLSRGTALAPLAASSAASNAGSQRFS